MDPEKWLEKYSPQMGEEQRRFFHAAIEGNRYIGWWRGGRREVMKAIFDYIMDERGESDAQEKGTKEEDKKAG